MCPLQSEYYDLHVLYFPSANGVIKKKKKFFSSVLNPSWISDVSCKKFLRERYVGVC